MTNWVTDYFTVASSSVTVAEMNPARDTKQRFLSLSKRIGQSIEQSQQHMNKTRNNNRRKGKKTTRITNQSTSTTGRQRVKTRLKQIDTLWFQAYSCWFSMSSTKMIPVFLSKSFPNTTKINSTYPPRYPGNRLKHPLMG